MLWITLRIIAFLVGLVGLLQLIKSIDNRTDDSIHSRRRFL